MLRIIAVVAGLCAFAQGAIIAPQPQPQVSPTAYNANGYYLAQPVVPYSQPAGFYYAPVLTTTGADQQQLALRAGYDPNLVATDGSGRFLSTLFPSLFPTTSSLQALLNQLIATKSDTLIGIANVQRSNQLTGGAAAGTVVFYQKSAASNLNVLVNIQYTDAANALTAASTGWAVEIRSATALSTTAATQCSTATAAALFAPSGVTGAGTIVASGATTSMVVAAAPVNAVLSVLTTVSPNIATLFQPNSIVDKTVVVSLTGGNDNSRFCGIVALA